MAARAFAHRPPRLCAWRQWHAVCRYDLLQRIFATGQRALGAK